eukprot:snap_masked-scaffold_16-processed-gene-2.25-mRNA-1 protein AED:1.00 eAED:1.00 QI:0/-1/0/0/-1/1/1/0/167
MIFLSSFLFLIIIKRVKSQLELRATVLSGTSHSSCDNSVFNRDDEAVFAIKAEPESKYAFYNGEGYNCPKHNPDDDGPDEFYSEEVSCSDQYETMEFCVVSSDAQIWPPTNIRYPQSDHHTSPHEIISGRLRGEIAVRSSQIKKKMLCVQSGHSKTVKIGVKNHNFE